MSSAHTRAKPGPQLVEPPPSAVSEGGTGQSCPWGHLHCGSHHCARLCCAFAPPSPPPSQPPPPAHSAELAQQDQKNQRHHVRDQQKCLQNGSLMIKRSLQMPSTHPGKGKLETRGGDLSTTSQLAPQCLPYSPNGHIFPFRNFLSESIREKRALAPPSCPPPPREVLGAHR